MASEQVLDVPLRPHVFDSERPFAAVLDGIFGGISQPDIEALFSKLAASTSYEQFSSLVQQAQGSIGLMRFLQLDCDSVLTLDPRSPARSLPTPTRPPPKSPSNSTQRCLTSCVRRPGFRHPQPPDPPGSSP